MPMSASCWQARATTGCWWTVNMRPTTCAPRWRSCRPSPAPGRPCPLATHPPTRWCASRMATPPSSNKTWTSVPRPCWCRWWTPPSRRPTWRRPAATRPKVSVAWAAPWPARPAGSSTPATSTRPMPRSACWCRPRPCWPWTTWTPSPPHPVWTVCLSARPTCRRRWVTPATPATLPCRRPLPMALPAS